MTIRQIMQTNQSLETELILGHALRKPKEFLYTHPETELSAKQLETFKALVARRKKGEPVAYLLGYKDFFGLRFKVTKDTLIPRPETEWVVERTIKLCHPKLDLGSIKMDSGYPSQASGVRNDKKISVLDLGTGSGCIAISIKMNAPKLTVTASDISTKALTIAKQNARNHKVKIVFKKSNLLSELNSEKFDIIIANLPYGWATWNKTTPENNLNIKFEPQLALITKEHGLYLYRQLLQQISKEKNKQKKVYLEFDPRQKSRLEKLIKASLPQAKTKFFKDLAKLWRYAEISI